MLCEHIYTARMSPTLNEVLHYNALNAVKQSKYATEFPPWTATYVHKPYLQRGIISEKLSDNKS